MSMRKDHAQAIADKLAIDEHGELFRDLPQNIQKDLLKRGGELANEELMTRNENERAIYAEPHEFLNWDV